MTGQIVSLYADLDARALIEAQVEAHVTFTQKEIFFRLAALKAQRVRELKSRFEGKPLGRVLVSANLGAIGYSRVGTPVEVLPKDFFHVSDQADLERKAAQLQDALVIINNNDAYGPPAPPNTDFSVFFTRCQQTAFLVWDWDNHHWMQRTTFLAVHSDLYFPAHNENMYLLSRLNWLLCGPVPCGTVQWSKTFLTTHLDALLQTPRRDEPLGMHLYYPKFNFRNQTVVTLKQHYPSIDFSTSGFHGRTDLDRLTEWCQHKSHWIIPVLNDIPIRLFDALTTGGIPIVPQSLAFLNPIRDIPRTDIIFYSPLDIVEPRKIVEQANALFDAGGAEGVARRHRFGLAHHHGESRLNTMIDCAQEVLGFATSPAHGAA